jgi:hypothetical protein
MATQEDARRLSGRMSWREGKEVKMQWAEGGGEKKEAIVAVVSGYPSFLYMGGCGCDGAKWDGTKSVSVKSMAPKCRWAGLSVDNPDELIKLELESLVTSER